MGNDRTVAARPRRRGPRAARRGLSLLLLAWVAGATAAAPLRIASLNLCTDSMLFELLDDARIVSVTTLSRDPGLSPFHARAARLEVNHGTAEELLAVAPDLVLTGSGGTRLAERLLTALGVPVLIFDHADSLVAYGSNLRRLAAVLDVRRRAETILAELDARLDAVIRPSAPAPRAVVYQPNGYVPGTRTLMHDILERAGYADLAAELGLDFGGFVALERLVATRPAVVVVSVRDNPAPSLAEQLLDHPAVRASNAMSRRVRVDENLWTCAGGFSAAAVEALARARP
jgi:iron complex transport system substrate-binding protein